METRRWSSVVGYDFELYGRTAIAERLNDRVTVERPISIGMFEPRVCAV
jgi:hypothetical protein